MPKVIKPKKLPWRLAFTLLVWGALFGTAAWAARRVQTFVLTDRHFNLSPADSAITIQGLQYASRARVMQTFSSDFGVSAFHMPLDERRRRLLAIDWVEDASLSRLWPNRLVVRVKERKPAAFVHMPGGRYSLIDSQGVFLSPPHRAHFDFPVLSGVTEEQNESERREQVHAMQAILADLGPAAKQISEIDASNLHDLRITTQLDHHAVELWMGDMNFASRYQNFVNHFPEIRKTSGGTSIFDLRLDDRITTK